jgi:dienelactone hydrolase
MQVRYLPMALLIGLAIAIAGPAVGAEIVQPRGLIRESAVVSFGHSGQAPLKLDGVVTRPAVERRSPLVVINHGSPRNSADLVGTTPAWANAIANEFARRGSAVAVVTRRGYGSSEGRFSEGYGTCKKADFTRAGLASAADVSQIIRHFQREPYVDAGRVLVVGVSAGGLASIATASLALPGVLGALNFAGGRGSTSADFVCSPEALVDAYRTYGKSVRVPTLWIYSENDHFFGPALAHKMFAAFQEAGGMGELTIAPPFGNDGHRLIFDPTRWHGLADEFLQRLGLPNVLPKLPPPRGASEKMLQEFARYAATPNYEKAFVIGANGRFRWVSRRKTAEDAIADALGDCGAGCRPYAVDDTLAGTAERTPGQ